MNKSIDLYSSIPLKNEPIRLTAEQQAAFDALLPGLEDAAPHSALLYGVTGSGKTLVFLKLIERCLALGRRALVLVPEISLTPQMILRLKGQFGRRVAVQHSALNHTERLLQWQMIQDGGADIVVGTRSAIFAPLENIGLIIIDEEQEHTYRSESSPRYAAHEVARQRASENGALLLLASATPSTESFYAAQQGRTQLVRLTQRYGGNPLPSVQIVDMRAELASGNPREISLAMDDAIRRNLDAGKQTILLLNRRGYQTMAQCEDCREVLKCPKCSVPMVYHKAGHKLLCHYCGTQKAEEELAELFPEARVLRMDLDTTRKKGGYESILSAFSNQEADILIGTQMIVKGHDFPNVTLVGILAADLSLHISDYRAPERTFQLLTQAAGRAGRGCRQGEVVIQTYQPEHYSIVTAAAQDYEAFFQQEIFFRDMLHYPPKWHMLVVHAASEKEMLVKQAQDMLKYKLLTKMEKEKEHLQIIGPADAAVSRINDIFRKVLYVKAEDYQLLVHAKNMLEQEIRKDPAFRAVTIQFDFDPMNGF